MAELRDCQKEFKKNIVHKLVHTHLMKPDVETIHGCTLHKVGCMIRNEEQKPDEVINNLIQKACNTHCPYYPEEEIPC